MDRGLEETSSVRVIEAPGRLPQVWDRRAIFVANLLGLFVGNEEGSAVRGATMGFYSSDGKVRFAVNKQSAKKSKLKISSELLKLAKIVGMPQ